MTTDSYKASQKRQREFRLNLQEFITEQQETGISYAEMAIVLNQEVQTTLMALNQLQINPNNELDSSDKGVEGSILHNAGDKQG